MEEINSLIDKLIEDHKVINKEAETLEKVANDVETIGELEKAKATFMPGRLDQKQSLLKFQDLLGTIDKGLKAHFNREETALLNAFEKHGDKELASALHSLLLEHEGLINRFTHSKKQISDLVAGGLSRQLWESNAHDIRAHISHTRKLLEAHAKMEEEILKKLRRKLIGM